MVYASYMAAIQEPVYVSVDDMVNGINWLSQFLFQRAPVRQKVNVPRSAGDFRFRFRMSGILPQFLNNSLHRLPNIYHWA